MAVGNEKAKSIILTTNRDFRAKSVGMLNNLAFAADKLSANSIDEIRVQLNRDKTVVNVVIDAASMTDPEFGHFVEKWDDIMKGRDVRALVFYQESQKALIDKHIEKAGSWAHTEIVPLPQTKPQYVQCFYAARQKGHGAFPGAQAIKPDEPKTAPALQPAPPTPATASDKTPKNTSFFEASQHVRDTIESLNKISKDHSAVGDIVKVGQRFNGIIGGFAFFGDKDGYRELVKLSDTIDTVARAYQSPGGITSVKETHVEFILEAAKCALIMLKELRETTKLSPGTLTSFSNIVKRFDGLTDIRKKAIQGQDEIDKLLADAQKLAS